MSDIAPAAVGEVEQVNSDDRRNLLAEQLDAVHVDAVAEPVDRADPVMDKPAGDRVRTPDGKFAPKTEAKTDAPVTAEAPVIEEPAWKLPPKSWKKDYHDQWGKVDPKVAEYIHARENEMRGGIESARTKALEYDRVAKVVAPYMQTIQSLGIDAPTAIKGLMEADNHLRTAPHDQKRAYILKLAASYGINLGDVSDAIPVNPQIHEVQTQVQQLRAQLEGERRAKEEAESRSLLEQIQKFATTKEHFEEAKPTMIQLLQSGVATDLEDAYKKAVRLNDDLFQTEQTARQAQSEAEKKAAKDQAAKAARSAAVSSRSSTPGTATQTKAQDRRSMLSEQFEGIGDRL
jgi:hypothetical protein